MIQLKLVLQNKPNHTCMTKLVLSAQGIFKAGLHLFLYLTIPPCWSFFSANWENDQLE